MVMLVQEIYVFLYQNLNGVNDYDDLKINNDLCISILEFKLSN